MGGAINHYVLSARFMLTVGHLIAILLVFSNLKTNVNASFGDNASSVDIDAAIASSQVCVWYSFPHWMSYFHCIWQ